MSNPKVVRTVQRVPKSDIWYCDCPWFHYHLTRGMDRHCYHIQSCILHREEDYSKRNVERIDGLKYYCPRCNSTDFKKNGTRKLATGTKRQVYKCNVCNHKFSLLPKGVFRYEEQSRGDH